VRLHCETEYRVYMNGFIPGFAYLGLTNKAIDVPRRPEPVVVARGSVAIAGRQTGIYPATITGGWQVIGRTPVVMFDPARDPAVLLRTGMRVRFRPIDLDSFLQFRTDGLADH
jgi:KipI family sensor histidine kinase inhibitor